jgi:hypothetical protein
LNVQRFKRSATIKLDLGPSTETSSEVIIRETNRFQWLRQSRKVEPPFHEGFCAKTVSQQLYRQHFLERHLRCCH